MIEEMRKRARRHGHGEEKKDNKGREGTERRREISLHISMAVHG